MWQNLPFSCQYTRLAIQKVLSVYFSHIAANPVQEQNVTGSLPVEGTNYYDDTDFSEKGFLDVGGTFLCVDQCTAFY